jgi:hypothetical protein
MLGIKLMNRRSEIVSEGELFAGFRSKFEISMLESRVKKSAQLEGASKPITETLAGNNVHRIGHYFVLALTTKTDAACGA